MMHGIEVRGIHDGTFIFTVTDQDRAPWGTSNTTIFVPPEQLVALVSKLQARLQDIQQLRPDVPALTIGERVHILGHHRRGQYGVVLEVREKEPHVQRRSGQRWAYTGAFDDTTTWTYNAGDLERLGGAGTPASGSTA